MAVEEQVVGLRPVAAADDVDVAGAARHDQAGLGALALDQRVDGGGRAVDQLVDRAGVDAALAEAVDDALRQLAPAWSGSWPARSVCASSSKPIRSVKVPPISTATKITHRSRACAALSVMRCRPGPACLSNRGPICGASLARAPCPGHVWQARHLTLASRRLGLNWAVNRRDTTDNPGAAQCRAEFPPDHRQGREGQAVPGGAGRA